MYKFNILYIVYYKHFSSLQPINKYIIIGLSLLLLTAGDRFLTRSDKYYAEIDKKGRSILHTYKDKEIWKTKEDGGDLLLCRKTVTW